METPVYSESPRVQTTMTRAGRLVFVPARLQVENEVTDDFTPPGTEWDSDSTEEYSLISQETPPLSSPAVRQMPLEEFCDDTATPATRPACAPVASPLA